MKFFKYNLMSVCAASLMFVSCDLTQEPEDTMSPDTYFKTATQLGLWTQGYYDMLDSDGIVATNADGNVDNALGKLMMGQRTAASSSGWNWGALRRVNYYFEHKACDESVSAPYDAESYFFRAYFYFVKVRRFGDVPYYTQVLKDNDTELLRKKRDDRGYVIDRVLEDLDEAYRLGTKSRDLVKVTKWTALALKSRVALYEGTWRKYRGLPDADKYLRAAADAAEEFISNSGYSIQKTGSEPYRNLFNAIDATNTEVVLARKYGNKANVMHSIPFNIKNDRQGFTRRFMNHYLMADGSFYSSVADYDRKMFADEVAGRDPRLSQTVLCPGYIQVGATKVTANDLTAITGYQPIKYVGNANYDGSKKAFTDLPLFRAAEVYLNFAEAKAELGTLTQDDLDRSVNKIRDRVGMPHMSMVDANSNIDPLMVDYYPNVTQSGNTGVILEIRRERTIELCLEGFRQWDILRWKEGAQLTRPFYGVYFPAEGEYDMDGDGKADLLVSSAAKPASWKGNYKQIGKDITLTGGSEGMIHALPNLAIEWNEERDYLWPIPASERVLSGGALSQNPGWTDTTNFD